jgi:glycosyltransferase involved in cell wall biosynthesis
MRIAWFTPFGRDSAIGRASQSIVAELARSVEVDIWHPAAKVLLGTAVRTISFPPEAPLAAFGLQAYDLAVYNFGNHLEYHRQIFEISRRTPGIHILHDLVLHHFFARYYLDYRRAPATYVQVMERWYGEPGKAAARASSQAGNAQPVWLSDDVARYPLFEEALQGAYGVVAHSEFLTEEIRRVFKGPVATLPLAYDPVVPARMRSRKSLGIGDDRLLVVTVGNVNRNKRIDKTIAALAGHPDLAARVQYVVIGDGDPEYRAELAGAVRAAHLTHTVQFAGRLSDDDLAAYLSHADICVNLRYPAFEGASASLIEQLLYGRPVIVTDTGCYRELPDDCVWKVRPEQETGDLVAGLRRLIKDEALRRRLGETGKQYARSTFRADRYAAGILELAEEVLYAKPLLVYADRVGREIARLGLGPEAALVSTVSEASAELFGDS